MVRDFYLPDATLSVVFDPLANEYRMILMSYCTSMCVSMKCKSSALGFVFYHTYRPIVPPSFFNGALGNSGIDSAAEHPAYFVKVGWDTTDVIERPIKFTLLLPADEDGKSLSLLGHKKKEILTHVYYSPANSQEDNARCGTMSSSCLIEVIQFLEWFR